MPAPTDKEASPPYISFTTTLNFINSLREAVLPNRIDRTLLSGQAGGTQTYILSALRFLGFTENDGTPTSRFSAWTANPTEEKRILSEAIREGYPFFFNGECNIEAATEGEVTDILNRYFDYNGSTARKAISFFVAACDFADIQISPHLKGKRGGGSSGGPKRAKKRKTNGNPAPQDPVAEIKQVIPSGMNVATLPLSADGSRYVRLEAPRTISTGELTRIQQWLSFQLIVTDNSPQSGEPDLFEDPD